MWTRIDKEELVVEATQLASLFWSSVLSRNKGLDKVFKRRSDKVIGADLFMALYDWNPVIKQEDVPNEAVKEYIERLSGTQKFEKLRKRTKGDKYAASGGAVRLFRELMRSNESQFKAMSEVAQYKENVELLFTNKEAQQIAMEPLKRVEEGLAQGIANTKVEGAGQFTPNQYGRMDRGAEASELERVDTVDEDLANMEELSVFDGGGGYSLDPNTRGEKLLETLLDEKLIALVGSQDKLRDILRVSGRMKLILEGARSRKPVASPVSEEMTYGNDLDRVIPAELAYLSDPELEDLFYLKYYDESLRQRDKKSKDKQGEGPFIACVDVSGSMRGWRETAGMALFVSMARMAVRKKRKVVFVPFASSHRQVEVTSAQEMAAALTGRYQLGSGTEFEGPLSTAEQIIKSQKYYAKADVLVISDGDGYVRDTWVSERVEEKKALGYRLFGISVNNNEWPSNMKGMWDAQTCISGSNQLSDLNWLEQVAERLV